jgi:hypothetical protein
MCDGSEGETTGVDVQRRVDEYVGAVDPPPQEILELDYVFEALAHSRRRYILYSLHAETEWTLRDLARKLVAWEQNIPESAVLDHERDEMYVSLYHTHLPKLVAWNIIKIDGGSGGTIVPAENAVQVLAALEGVGASLDTAQESHARDETDRK